MIDIATLPVMICSQHAGYYYIQQLYSHMIENAALLQLLY